MNQKLRSIFVLGIPILLFAACGGVPSADGDGADLKEQTAPLWIQTGVTKWPFGIPVCFRAGNFPQATRTAIRQLVENNWERAAFIDFFGWGECPTNPFPTGNMVVVSVNPSISGLGQSDVGKITNTINIIDFKTASPSNHSILHEFGHTLGFIHEHQNDDGLCARRTSGGTSLENEGDVALSVLSQSACNTMAALSAWDVMGVRNAYGRKPSGTIAGLGGLALNIRGANTAFGTDIIGWPETGS